MKRTLLILILAVAVTSAQSWSVQNSGTTSDLYSVWFTSSLNGWTAGAGGTVLHTTNGGASWAESSFTTLWLSGITFKDSQVGLAVGAGGCIFRTTNAGANWVQESSGTTLNLASVAFGTGSAAYTAGDNGIVLRSTDDGATWHIALQHTANWRGVCAYGNNQVWVVGFEGFIMLSTDAGVTWQQPPHDFHYIFHNVFFADTANGWAVGPLNQLIRSTNGGDTWTLANTGISAWLDGVHFVTASEGWVVGQGGAIYHTVNGGTLWTAESSATSNELFDVHFSDASHGWAVGVAGTIVFRPPPGMAEERREELLQARSVPNPVVTHGHVSFSLPGAYHPRVRVLDAAGRLVRTLAVTSEEGRLTAHWDCTSTSGRRAAAGVYFYELRSSSTLLRAPVVVLGN